VAGHGIEASRSGEAKPEVQASELIDRLRTQLATSEARFRSIIERNADGILIVDHEGRARYVNPAAERLFGRSAADLLGNEFGLAMVPGETTEIDIVRHDGPAEIVAELRASATSWEGEPAQLITLRDVTDRREAEERAQRLLREQAARERAEEVGRRASFLAEAAKRLDSSLDPTTTLRSLSQLIVPRLADWCVIDLVEGESISRIAAVHSDPDRQAVLDELRQRYPPRRDRRQPAGRVILSGEPELYTGLNSRKLRALALDSNHAELLEQLGVRSWMAVPLQARDACLGAITFLCGERDFTELDLALAGEIGSQAGRALDNAQLYEAAVAANKAKTDFLAIMSHELRTPLNAILGYTQLLLEDVYGEVGDAQREQLRRVNTSASQLLQIINEILVYASLEAGRTNIERQCVKLRVLVEDAAAMTSPLAREKGLTYAVELEDPAAEVFTDAGKVRQILVNLLTNAVKFTEMGSVTLRAHVRDDELVVAVIDTGVGIPENSIDAIFEPFRQVEGPLTRHTGGTGLGLSVAKRLASLLGGRITVSSEVGTGSTFMVRLPAAGNGDQASTRADGG
jgi:signal transduction histidine kinase